MNPENLTKKYQILKRNYLYNIDGFNGNVVSRYASPEELYEILRYGNKKFDGDKRFDRPFEVISTYKSRLDELEYYIKLKTTSLVRNFTYGEDKDLGFVAAYPADGKIIIWWSHKDENREYFPTIEYSNSDESFFEVEHRFDNEENGEDSY